LFSIFEVGSGEETLHHESVSSQTIFIQIVQAIVNDTDGGLHVSGEITHSRMKILCLGNL